jgi:hypothetical protein
MPLVLLEPSVIELLTAKRGEVAKCIADLIMINLKPKSRSVLRVIWDLCDVLMIRCDELCEQGLDYSAAEVFARIAIVPCDRQRWLDDEYFARVGKPRS